MAFGCESAWFWPAAKKLPAGEAEELPAGEAEAVTVAGQRVAVMAVSSCHVAHVAPRRLSGEVRIGPWAPPGQSVQAYEHVYGREEWLCEPTEWEDDMESLDLFDFEFSETEDMERDGYQSDSPLPSPFSSAAARWREEGRGGCGFEPPQCQQSLNYKS